jgi:hypothetical protein
MNVSRCWRERAFRGELWRRESEGGTVHSSASLAPNRYRRQRQKINTLPYCTLHTAVISQIKTDSHPWSVSPPPLPHSQPLLTLPTHYHISHLEQEKREREKLYLVPGVTIKVRFRQCFNYESKPELVALDGKLFVHTEGTGVNDCKGTSQTGGVWEQATALSRI